ncbi:hypothetical protein [Endozoicomonas atrinae]|uniref:hypothetical protein n=1 Tax=Endozoicomonas atrinae TaxID=1333660 RepID=UPI000825C850|nr:hypothetical protein [Endozoicomonas atrinae]
MDILAPRQVRSIISSTANNLNHVGGLPTPTTGQIAIATNLPIHALKNNPPQWSNAVVDTLSVGAMPTAAGASFVQPYKDWKAYLQRGEVPNVPSNTWLIIDFAGRSCVLGMLLVQSLIQNVELTAFNFLTPASALVIEALVIETIVICSAIYFRCKQNNNDYVLLDDQSALNEIVSSE